MNPETLSPPAIHCDTPRHPQVRMHTPDRNGDVVTYYCPACRYQVDLRLTEYGGVEFVD